MPNVIKVFLASPEDVQDERERIHRVIERLNRIYSNRNQDLVIEPISGSVNAVPAMGNPQSQITVQLDPNSWDIFIGIFWHKFGTPTGNLHPETGELFLSGTEEEFYEAYKCWIDAGRGKWPRIMIYRCDRPAKPSEINQEQLTPLNQFFSNFAAEGEHPGYIREFEDPEKFEDLVFEHLDKTCNDFFEYHSKSDSSVSPHTVADLSKTNNVSNFIAWSKRDREAVQFFLDMYSRFNDREFEDEMQFLSWLHNTRDLIVYIDDIPYLTPAGALAFGPCDAIPFQTDVLISYHSSDQNGDSTFINMDRFPLMLLAKKLQNEIMHLWTRTWEDAAQRENGVPRQFSEYPETALIEAAVNLIIHRDYESKEKAYIDIFEDRIEFTNPGSATTDIQRILDSSSPKRQQYERNAEIIDLFTRTKLNQTQRGGLRRIRKALQDNNSRTPLGELGFEYENDVQNNSFKLILWRSHQVSHQNIPLQRPPRAEHFLARQDELTEIISQLQPGNIATISGPGGVGKSSLAAEVIWSLFPNNEPSLIFPDGIIYHSFYNQPLAVAALEHIAASVGEEIRGSPKDAAQRALSRRVALLVLDGAESADNLADVLDIRNRCGVLITTRNRGDAQEHRLDLAPLSIDDAMTLLREWSTGQKIAQSDAKQIVELVGKLPLALRLAGRYLAESNFSASDFVEWLYESPLTALDHGNRRIESVPLLLERSVAQLSDNAQAALALIGWLAFAPFPGESIVYALATEEKWAAQQGLGELVAFGLLQSEDKNWYTSSHTLIRSYAQTRLGLQRDSGIRLVNWIIESVNNKQADFAYLNRLCLHVITLQVRCTENEMWPQVVSLAWSISNYLSLQGFASDRITVYQAALYAARSHGNRNIESAWLNNLGLSYADQGDAEKSIVYYQQALTISREFENTQSEGSLLNNLGLSYTNLGEIEKAIIHYEQALSIARQSKDKYGEEVRLGNLGNAYANLGEIEKAIIHYEQALAISREIGNKQSEGNHLGNVGNAYTNLGEIEKAIIHYEQALAISRNIGHKAGEGINLGNLGNAYAYLGEIEKAISYYEQALAISREIGSRQSEGNHLGNLGNVYVSLGESEKAINYYEQALTISNEIDNKHGEGISLVNLGHIYTAQNQDQNARDSWQKALRIFEVIQPTYADTVRKLLEGMDTKSAKILESST